jgi:transposase
MHQKGMNQRQLAKIFGISNQTVSRIVNRKIWTHV